MKIWFHNTRFSLLADSTSHALDLVDSLLRQKGLEPKEFSIKHDYEHPGSFDVRLGLIGIGDKTPLHAYLTASQVMQYYFEGVSFDSYSIENGTVQFLVSKFLEPALEKEVKE